MDGLAALGVNAAALGNHDLLVQGELPPSADTDAIATGREVPSASGTSAAVTRRSSSSSWSQHSTATRPPTTASS